MTDAATILFDRENSRNWQCDYTHENGNYCNTCIYCLRLFIGHKRRISCRECYNKPMEEIKVLPETKRELLADCFNPAETDEQYFLRRKKDLGLKAYYKPFEEK